MPYTLIDHTADTGMRVSSPTVEGLFVEAALALSLLDLLLVNGGRQ